MSRAFSISLTLQQVPQPMTFKEEPASSDSRLRPRAVSKGVSRSVLQKKFDTCTFKSCSSYSYFLLYRLVLLVLRGNVNRLVR